MLMINGDDTVSETKRALIEFHDNLSSSVITYVYIFNLMKIIFLPPRVATVRVNITKSPM